MKKRLEGAKDMNFRKSEILLGLSLVLLMVFASNCVAEPNNCNERFNVKVICSSEKQICQTPLDINNSNLVVTPNSLYSPGVGTTNIFGLAAELQTSPSATVVGINNSGIIAGYYFSNALSRHAGFYVDRQAKVHTFSDAGGAVIVTGISDSGAISGHVLYPDGAHFFLYTESAGLRVLAPLNLIGNTAIDVTAQNTMLLIESRNLLGSGIKLWSEASYKSFFPYVRINGISSPFIATDINDGLTVAGRNASNHLLRWNEATGAQILGRPANATASYPSDINNAGDIVGYSLINSAPRGFVWRNICSLFVDLSTMINQPTGQQITVTHAIGINESRSIVAAGTVNGFTASLLLTPASLATPQPTPIPVS